MNETTSNKWENDWAELGPNSEAPEAPAHYSSSEAFAWQAGWESRGTPTSMQVAEVKRHSWHESSKRCMCGERISNPDDLIRHVLLAVGSVQ